METKSNLIQTLIWGKEINKREEKEQIAGYIAGKVSDGDVIGVGSGSSSYMALLAIAERVIRERLSILVIPTSTEISLVCAQLGIPVTTLAEHLPDWGFDGTDEFDPAHNLIKGRGGAMFREKILIRASRKTYILAESGKRVATLGSRFAVPVEVFPMALPVVEKALNDLPVQSLTLRMASGKDGPVFTENGNLILDVRFKLITNELEQQLKLIPGVIESGLFMHYPSIEVIETPVL